jgi:hypothetical protein
MPESERKKRIPVVQHNSFSDGDSYRRNEDPKFLRHKAICKRGDGRKSSPVDGGLSPHQPATAEHSRVPLHVSTIPSLLG